MDLLSRVINQHTETFYNQEGHIIFGPPLYIQRYLAAINCLKHEVFKKKICRIVEFGCSEMKFFPHIKSALTDRNVSIKLVDIDEEVLLRCQSAIQPLIMDHVKKREYDMNVELWVGDVSIHNPNFKNIDAVVAIELIEHVGPNVLNEIPYQIFGKLHPKIVIISTPNCEFNCIFDLKAGEFRHDDHKFEWNREQFKAWCNNICERFPDYTVELEGIGKPPNGFEVEQIGYGSQFALFAKKVFVESLRDQFEKEIDEAQCDIIDDPSDYIPCEGYKLLTSVNYPVFKDTRSRCEKINDEVCYHVNRYRYMGDEFYNSDSDRTEIPIDLISKACWEISTDENEISNVIKSRFQVENNLIILDNAEYKNESDDQNDDFEHENIL